MKRPPESNFSHALRLVRKARAFTQERFDDVSSRVYISALERGVKQPTLPKVDAIANVLGVHPLTLLAISYCGTPNADDIERLCEQVTTEVERLLLSK